MIPVMVPQFTGHIIRGCVTAVWFIGRNTATYNASSIAKERNVSNELSHLKILNWLDIDLCLEFVIRGHKMTALFSVFCSIE